MRYVFLIALAVPLLAAGCGGDKGTASPSASASESTSPSGGSPTFVEAVEADFSISLDPTSISAGDVKFDVTNNGPSDHEFVVFKTDLAEDQLPVTDGAVDESGEGVEHIDEIEDIGTDAPKDLEVTLDAGNYVVICNLPGHYEQGMHASLAVA
jgi:uncharacterized cupredoxin-like copper-binding protein